MDTSTYEEIRKNHPDRNGLVLKNTFKKDLKSEIDSFLKLAKSRKLILSDDPFDLKFKIKNKNGSHDVVLLFDSITNVDSVMWHSLMDLEVPIKQGHTLFFMNFSNCFGWI